MLDGLRYVITQIAVIVVAATILAGTLGWLVGRASGRRSAAKALAPSPGSRLQAAPAAAAPPLTPTLIVAPSAPAVAEAADTPAYAPAVLVAGPLAPTAPPVGSAAFTPPATSADVVPTPPTAPADAVPPFAARAIVEPTTQAAEPAPVVPEPVVGRTTNAPTHGYGEPPHTYSEHSHGYAEATHGYAQSADDQDDEDEVDPDRTVLRPAPSWTAPSKTPQYAPPRFAVVSPTPTESALVQRTASTQEVQELRRELRIKELELGRLEAGALSAWDRTVPRLEAEILDLQDENAALRRTIRDAQEHADADAQTVERLRASIAERDARLAHLRAQG